MKVQNVSPLGDLEVDGVGFVAAGQVFDVTDDVAERLLEQPQNFIEASAAKTEESK